MKHEKMDSEEEVARKRVENSPLRFLTIGHYSGNHPNRTVNSLPKDDQARFNQSARAEADYE